MPQQASEEYNCRDGAYLGGDIFCVEAPPPPASFLSIEDVSGVPDCQRYCSSVKQCVAVGYDAHRRCLLKSAAAAFQSDPTGWPEGARACRKQLRPLVFRVSVWPQRAGDSTAPLTEQFQCEEN